MKMSLKGRSSLFLSIGLTAAILMILFFGLDQTEKEMEQNEPLRLEESLRRAAADCYSMEGFYPARLDYLIEHYGVLVDEERYHVYYETMGSNIMPVIEVIRKE